LIFILNHQDSSIFLMDPIIAIYALYWNYSDIIKSHDQSWDRCRIIMLPRWSRQWSWKSGGEFPAQKIAYRSIACLHARLGWCTKPFLTRTVTSWKTITLI
jgi:hypothetical protein